VRKATGADASSHAPIPTTVHNNQLGITVSPGEPSRSLPREVWLDADLLDSGEFAWGVVQHEFAGSVSPRSELGRDEPVRTVAAQHRSLL
jgi:hypothetical protein